jgi:hypothetical protein
MPTDGFGQRVRFCREYINDDLALVSGTNLGGIVTSSLQLSIEGCKFE